MNFQPDIRWSSINDVLTKLSPDIVHSCVIFGEMADTFWVGDSLSSYRVVGQYLYMIFVPAIVTRENKITRVYI